mmetsp:Transcript_16333/g.41415  ORF Transcript_16333/g.41415 Transcript_16333/m.41415 type:complete len:461 (+) Transcript_16333:415-1797(+)
MAQSARVGQKEALIYLHPQPPLTDPHRKGGGNGGSSRSIHDPSLPPRHNRSGGGGGGGSEVGGGKETSNYSSAKVDEQEEERQHEAAMKHAAGVLPQLSLDKLGGEGEGSTVAKKKRKSGKSKSARGGSAGGETTRRNKKNVEISFLQERIAELENVLVKVVSHNKKAEFAPVKPLTEKINRLERQLHQSTATHSTITHQNKLLTGENEVLKQKNENLKGEVNHLKTLLGIADSTERRKRQQLELKNELATVKEIAEKKDMELRAAENKIKALQSELTAVIKANEAEKKNLNAEIDELKKEKKVVERGLAREQTTRKEEAAKKDSMEHLLTSKIAYLNRMTTNLSSKVEREMKDRREAERKKVDLEVNLRCVSRVKENLAKETERRAKSEKEMIEAYEQLRLSQIQKIKSAKAEAEERVRMESIRAAELEHKLNEVLSSSMQIHQNGDKKGTGEGSPLRK